MTGSGRSARSGRWACWAAVLIGTASLAETEASREVWSGRVTQVVDGDTVRVRGPGDKRPRAVRIQGIDAPEICQSGGAASRQVLEQQLLRRQVTFSVTRQDQFGRDLAVLWLDGQDVGRALVLQGHAWSYRYKHDPGPYENEEQAAQAAGRGLFAQSSPERPSEFRKRHGSCHPRE